MEPREASGVRDSGFLGDNTDHGRIVVSVRGEPGLFFCVFNLKALLLQTLHKFLHHNEAAVMVVVKICVALHLFPFSEQRVMDAAHLNKKFTVRPKLAVNIFQESALLLFVDGMNGKPTVSIVKRISDCFFRVYKIAADKACAGNVLLLQRLHRDIR